MIRRTGISGIFDRGCRCPCYSFPAVLLFFVGRSAAEMPGRDTRSNLQRTTGRSYIVLLPGSFRFYGRKFPGDNRFAVYTRARTFRGPRAPSLARFSPDRSSFGARGFLPNALSPLVQRDTVVRTVASFIDRRNRRVAEFWKLY